MRMKHENKNAWFDFCIYAWLHSGAHVDEKAEIGLVIRPRIVPRRKAVTSHYPRSAIVVKKIAWRVFELSFLMSVGKMSLV